MLQAQDSFPSMHRLRKDERSVGTEKEGDSGQDTGPGQAQEVQAEGAMPLGPPLQDEKPKRRGMQHPQAMVATLTCVPLGR